MHYLWDKSRTVVGILGGALVGWWLIAVGWPWWAWLPAALLGGIGFQAAHVLCWFAYRKLSYQRLARIYKRRHRAAED